MAGQPHHPQAWTLRRFPIQRRRVLDGDAELVLAQAGGDVGVRPGVHIRIDAQGDRGAKLKLARNMVNQLQFGDRLHVETANTRRQRLPDFSCGLAHAGEHNTGRVAAGTQHARQLAAGDDVETAAQPRQGLQHRQVGVGLDREADAVRQRAEGLVVGAIAILERGARIDIQRRPEIAGQGLAGHVFDAERAFAEREEVVSVHRAVIRRRHSFPCHRHRRRDAGRPPLRRAGPRR